jgi:hypothetical protein
LCEKAVENVFPGRSCLVRAGLIVGPYDYIDRFAYWVSRIARGGDVLAPGHPERQIQLIDARDLADWTIRITEERAAGAYNASGPDYRLTMRRLLDECVTSLASNARLIWVSDEFLLDNKVGAFNELPLWIPEEQFPKFAGFLAFDCRRAMAAGLRFRPLADTIRDTEEWLRTGTAQPELAKEFAIPGLNAAMSEAREAELLRDWLDSR